VTIHRGSTVKLAKHVKRMPVRDGGEDSMYAIVRYILDDGRVHLVSDLNGVRYWNVSDLVEVK